MVSLWLPINSPHATETTVGGKGASLSRLATAGLPVPDAFHLTCHAYRTFTDHPHITKAINTPHHNPSHSCHHVQQAMAATPIPEPIRQAVQQGQQHIGDHTPVAVRSSATAEDSPHASFAGQMDSYLHIRGHEAILTAIKNCWMSLWNERAIAYRLRHHIDAHHTAMAVTIQQLINADTSGVMFTLDPLTGRTDHTTINATWGLGENLVGGHVTPDTITVDNHTHHIINRVTSNKTTQTTTSNHGTTTTDVPKHQREQQTLSDTQAAQLTALGNQVSTLAQQACDIEWALHNGQPWLLQARPITSHTPPPEREEWNDTLTGDFLWTASNVGEAVPNVMTPVTASIVQTFVPQAMGLPEPAPHHLCGNIGGRLYLNYSLFMSIAKAIGMGRLIASNANLIFGQIPHNLDIPTVPLKARTRLRLISATITTQRTIQHYQKHLDTYINQFPQRCDAARTAIAHSHDRDTLSTTWHNHCAPLQRDAPLMLAAGSRVNSLTLARLHPWLSKLVNDTDANILATGTHNDTQTLESLGPLQGLHDLANGKIDRDTYNARWGHRCPDELELSAPRPAEDPNWIDQHLHQNPHTTDINTLLQRQEQNRADATRRFSQKHPHKLRTLQRRTARAAQAIRSREATRSEAVRNAWVLRDFVRRAGDITGLHDDIYFLTIDEILHTLQHHTTPDHHTITKRRHSYHHYRALPTYPNLIRGHFPIEQWAQNPRHTTNHDSIRGVPASAGTTEGTARLLTDPTQQQNFHTGDILITTATNIGWTPLFPRAGAIVTDIGASLSHAAIVARELGIPAVVGCNNATTRIQTGQHIRVNGSNGTVEILDTPTTE